MTPDRESNQNRLLRAARMADVSAIAAIHVSAWQAGYAGIVPDSYLQALSIEQHTDVWRGRIERAAFEVWLLEEHGHVRGWIAYGPPRATSAQPHPAEIYAIYVAPASWSLGIGQSLLCCALERLAAQAYASCYLWVLIANARSRRFYERAGFTADPSAVKSISIGTTALDEIRYHRPLLHP
ncbi:MAG: GNAT family N-acetyltransferase [Steroidobacteraceae bacterium]